MAQNQSLLNSIKSTLDAALSNSDCASIFGTPGFLGGNATAAQVLNSLIGGSSQYGSIQFVDPDTATPFQKIALNDFQSAAATVSNHPIWSWFGGRSTSTIYISTLDAPGSFNSSTLDAEETILHELGHLLANLGWSGDTITNDTNNPTASAANTQKVISACGKYLQ
jgi:hypothetical protein